MNKSPNTKICDFDSSKVQLGTILKFQGLFYIGDAASDADCLHRWSTLQGSAFISQGELYLSSESLGFGAEFAAS